MDILRVEHRVDLIEPNHFCPIIVNEDNRLQHKPPLMMIARKAFLPAGESALQATHSPLACLPKQCVHVADFQQIIVDVAMQMSCTPFCDGTDEGAVRITALGEPLVNSYLVISNFFLQCMQKSCSQRAIGPTPWEIDCCKKYFPIRPIRKHIVDHRVSVVPAIKCILFDAFVRAFSKDRNSIHKADDVVHNRCPQLHRVSKLPHFHRIREFHLCDRMIAQPPNNQLKHHANHPAANRRRDTKNHAQMLVIHHATQIKKKQSKISLGMQQAGPSPLTTAETCYCFKIKEVGK